MPRKETIWMPPENIETSGKRGIAGRITTASLAGLAGRRGNGNTAVSSTLGAPARSPPTASKQQGAPRLLLLGSLLRPGPTPQSFQQSTAFGCTQVCLVSPAAEATLLKSKSPRKCFSSCLCHLFPFTFEGMRSIKSRWLRFHQQNASSQRTEGNRENASLIGQVKSG